jgi:hypothetical protein
VIASEGTPAGICQPSGKGKFNSATYETILTSLLQRNRDRALQDDDCQSGYLLSLARRVWPFVQFADLADKKRIS